MYYTYVMHIRLLDRHNVANHFCPQAFLSEQSFLIFIKKVPR